MGDWRPKLLHPVTPPFPQGFLAVCILGGRGRKSRRRGTAALNPLPNLATPFPNVLEELGLSRGLTCVQRKLICGVQHLPGQNPSTVCY